MNLKYSTAVFCGVTLLLAWSQAQAQPESDQWLAKAEELQLHKKAEWHTLGHYRPKRFSRGYTSEADDDRFFLSTDGDTNPKAELQANLRAMASNESEDEPFACRFPARDRWLRQQLDLPAAEADCPELTHWLEELNTERVTLVFSASYLNNPSSMFGHTFLRLDPPKDNGETDLLTANTISYAANADPDDNEIVFTWKGLTGGYPGVTAIEPYYEKINQYSEVENRDLYEYHLNLDAAEIEMLLLHAWELQDKHFDYYFFDQNCSYRLLALIDAARPGTNLIDEVGTHAIPADTVRWVVDRDLVESVNYRPASATVVAFQLSQLDDQERDLAWDLARGDRSTDDPTLKALPEDRQALVLDAAFDYLRYATLAYDWPRSETAPRSHELLVARSRMRTDSRFPAPPKPDVRDDQGHDTLRIDTSMGEQDRSGFAGLSVRGAYHDLLDPPGGYRAGAQLDFFRGDFRYYPGQDRLQVEELIAVDIRSFTPRDRFFRSLSWQAGGGARRARVEGGERRLVPYVAGGSGLSWNINEWVPFFLVTGAFEPSAHLEKGFDLAPGYEVGLLRQGQRLSFLGSLQGEEWVIGERQTQHRLELGAQWHLSKATGLRASFEREKFREGYASSWELSLNLYF